MDVRYEYNMFAMLKYKQISYEIRENGQWTCTFELSVKNSVLWAKTMHENCRF